MVTGFNTDVEHDGRTFHVQTEDRGRDNPLIETLVYTGGEIVTSRKTSYAEMARKPDYSEEGVLRAMESQHQTLIREILSGRYDPEGPKPFGYNIITNRSLDEVVQDFLASGPGVDAIQIEAEGQPVLLGGTEAVLVLRVTRAESGIGVAGAKVVVKLISSAERPVELFSGTTSADGRIEASIEIPEMEDGRAALLFQAEAATGNAEAKQFILKPGLTSV